MTDSHSNNNFNFEKDVLSFDKSDEVFNFKLVNSNIPIYLFVRHFLLQSIVNKKFSLGDYNPKPKFSIKRWVVYFFHSFIKNLFFIPKKSIYIFSSEIVYKKDKKGIYFNSLYDDLFNIKKKETGIITKSYYKKFSYPKNYMAYHNDFIKLVSRLLIRFKKINYKDLETIEKFINFIKARLKNKITQDDINYIKKTLIVDARMSPIILELYYLFFRLKRPSLVIVEGAHYFNGAIEIIISAKKLNIRTAEYQHGYIGPSHRAYNFSKNSLKFIKPFLPDDFLTFGRHWNSLINSPSKIREIGKKTVNKNNIIHKKHTRVLVISSGSQHENLILFILELIKLLPKKFKIFFRPHPTETSLSKIRYRELFENNISLDKSDLKKSLKKSNIVVSLEMSTVLYEALNYTKCVYLHDSPYINYYEKESIFLRYKTPKDLSNSFKQKKTVNIDYNNIWDKDFKNNYEKYLNSVML